MLLGLQGLIFNASYIDVRCFEGSKAGFSRIAEGDLNAFSFGRAGEAMLSSASNAARNQCGCCTCAHTYTHAHIRVVMHERKHVGMHVRTHGPMHSCMGADGLPALEDAKPYNNDESHEAKPHRPKNDKCFMEFFLRSCAG